MWFKLLATENPCIGNEGIQLLGFCAENTLRPRSPTLKTSLVSALHQAGESDNAPLPYSALQDNQTDSKMKQTK